MEKSGVHMKKNVLSMIVLGIAISSSTVMAESGLNNPFLISNSNPFVKIQGVPLTRSARLSGTGNLHGSIQTSISNSFSQSIKDGESILLDGETWNSSFFFSYGVTDKLDISINLPFLRHGKGELDSFIENWHSFFGLPSGGRTEVPRNRLDYRLLNEPHETFQLSSDSSDLGDISLLFSRELSQSEYRLWTLSAGIKLPTGRIKTLSGSGSANVSASLHYSNNSPFKTQGWHFNQSWGVIHNSKGELLTNKLRDWVFFGSSQIGWKAREKLSLKAQIDYHSPFYSSGLKELGSFSVQLTLGGTIRLNKRLALDISLSEDIATDTAPDVTFNFGLRRTF
ncbi:MAG: hypothetical protein CMQ40_08265 [Gammaproteobacteria bacterium]|nr:hypothetical protein [Gammaproteobacteria bacterium]